MTKINIVSGFLGAGKTTLIKKLLDGGAFKGEKVVLLENEYGEVGIDGGFMKETGVQITELNSGCICCTLVGDFTRALGELIDTYAPDRILIEPSGVGKLSDIRKVVDDITHTHPVQLCGCATVADVSKCRLYARNFGEFFIDQIESTETIILSRTQTASQERIEQCVALLREHNSKARIVTTPWDELDATLLLETIEHPDFLLTMEDIPYEEHHHHHDEDDDEEEAHEHHCCHHHHDDDDDEDEEHEHHCCHHHHHDDDDDEDDEHEHHCHHHHHDDEDDEDDEHEHHCHHHHHDNDEDEDEHEHHHECGCGCHHDHHGHHHADEIFENIGVETPKKVEEAKLREALEALDDDARFGSILRAKGILPTVDGKWIHFDYVPGEFEVRYGTADYTGRLCVIGCNLKVDEIRALLEV